MMMGEASYKPGKSMVKPGHQNPGQSWSKPWSTVVKSQPSQSIVKVWSTPCGRTHHLSGAPGWASAGILVRCPGQNLVKAQSMQLLHLEKAWLSPFLSTTPTHGTESPKKHGQSVANLHGMHNQNTVKDCSERQVQQAAIHTIPQEPQPGHQQVWNLRHLCGQPICCGDHVQVGAAKKKV